MIMKISVRLFARAKEIAGSERVFVELAENGSVADLKASLAGAFPALAPLVPHLLVAVGTEYAADGDRLPVDCEIACFPPVSGG